MSARVKAARWHVLVFRDYGHRCWLHRIKDPHTRVEGIDSAHIIPRSILGTALAYASPRLGRPLCRACHVAQGLGLDPAFQFPLADRVDAALAHNEIAKSMLPVPTE